MTEVVKLSPKPFLFSLLAFLFILLGSTAEAKATANQPVILVEGTSSLASPSDKRTAERSAKYLGTWLNELNIPYQKLSDDGLSDTTLRSAKVAILAYQPQPPAKELQLLRDFVKAGGKIIVIYSDSGELAQIMGLRIGPATYLPPNSQFSGWLLTPANNKNAQRIYQTSKRLQPIQANDILAWWLDKDGKKTRFPAIAATPNGIWFTQYLTTDDATNKKYLLLNLIANYAPEVWADAARQAISKAVKIGTYPNLKTACETISQANDEAAQTISGARQYYAAMIQNYQARRYETAVYYSRLLKNQLTTAYALSQKAKSREFRGVWDHEGLGLYPGDWDKTCSELAANGITAIFPNLAWGGIAHYKSTILPQSSLVGLYGDQLEQCLEAAHRHGLEVHVWIVCWNLEGAPADYVKRLGNRTITTSDGSARWLDPTITANQDLELAVISELVEKYEIDGIHLDYIRFPEKIAAYSPQASRDFSAWLGKPVKWPADASGRYAEQFQHWRALEVTKFVRRVHETVKDINRRVKISAAVYGNYSNSYRTVGQDWPTWIKEDLVDFICPMNYTTDNAFFTKLLASQMGLPRSERIYPGIGVTAGESQLEPDQVIDQIRLSRQMGSEGFLLFKLSRTLQERTLPLLGAGMLR